ncbi:hypothetical protein IEC97_25595 [Neobacillus cucumis]|uniref:hypothetical protein n=1 Tax=Neobacillus cucumis TaxID=1740721 RepID=UPI0018DFD20B|nr:hypothetical protein [Neobacillus cucumis]MBI0580716.1 hypothetical protein [Neobacillus cucumis]
MLNICILVKPIMDPASIKWDYQSQEFSYISNTFNSADLQALQWACDYKEKNGATITVMTAIDAQFIMDDKRILKHTIDKWVVLQHPDFKTSPGEAATILAKELSKHPFDVILTGSSSDDKNSGITPAKVAELLFIPSLTNIHSIDVKEERLWEVKRSEDRGIVQTYEVELPILIGVTNTMGRKRYIPRYRRPPKIQKELQVLEKGNCPSNVQVIKMTEPRPNIRYFNIPKDSLSAEERLLAIMGLSQDRKEQTGEKVASEVNDKTIHFISQKLQKWLQEG